MRLMRCCAIISWIKRSGLVRSCCGLPDSLLLCYDTESMQAESVAARRFSACS